MSYNQQFCSDYQHRLRSAVIAYLGGKCCQCGYSDPRALQIDHIDGGGNKDRSKRSWYKRYGDILSGADGGFQLLCANCNWIKRHDKGEWAHSCNPYTPPRYNKPLLARDSFDYWRKEKKLDRQGITQIIIKI